MKIRREVGEKGQVVIPRDIREYLMLRQGSKVVFEVSGNEVKIKSEKTPEEIIDDFLDVPKLKKKLTSGGIKKILGEQYDLP